MAGAHCLTLPADMLHLDRLSPARRYAVLFAVFFVLILATRWQIMPGQFYSFDEVNMVYAMDHIDTRLSQPQPPGYPLFIMEMRLLKLLRFVRPESNHTALALLSSAGAMTAMVWCGELIFGSLAGLYGALLMWLFPTFWYAGITSALRVQLALISALVGAACWRAWNGEKRWLDWSAAAVGFGAGIRPEIGPLLVPLWALGISYRDYTTKDRARSFSILTGSVLLWLIPLALNSGGLVGYFQNCWTYLAVQGATTSSLFGLDATRWLTNTILLLVWGFGTLIFLPLMLLLNRSGDHIGPRRWLFFATWLVPSLLFAIFVHVADPGHTLAMVVVVCLILGHQTERAVASRGLWRSPSWNWVLVAAIIAAIPGTGGGPVFYRWMIVFSSLVVAATSRFGTGVLALAIKPLPAAGLILFAPLLFFDHAFAAGYWPYATRPGITPERLASDFRLGFYLTSVQHVQEIVNPDDKAIRAAEQLVAQAPARSVIITENSITSWRKFTYYLPKVRVVSLESPATPTRPAVVTEWRREKSLGRRQGASPQPVDLPAGARIIWMVKPDTPFTKALESAFSLTESASARYVDLPAEPGSQRIGDFAFNWK